MRRNTVPMAFTIVVSFCRVNRLLGPLGRRRDPKEELARGSGGKLFTPFRRRASLLQSRLG